MSGLGAGSTTSNLHGEQHLKLLEGKSARFFQRQTAADGGCAFRAFNNALGKPLLTKLSLRKCFKDEKKIFQHCPKSCPEPGSTKLLSTAMLERFARSVGYSLRRVSAGCYQKEKFDWMLRQANGRFILVTMTDVSAQAKDGHDLSSRNLHHWMAVSADENLVLDSLARTLGPQLRSEGTLRRSIRDGILKIYEIVPVRAKKKGK